MKPLFRTSIALLTLLLLVPMLVAADAPDASPVLAPEMPNVAPGIPSPTPTDPTIRDNPVEHPRPDWSWAPFGFATTRSLYLLGQPVTFTYRNDTARDVELPGGAPWVIEDENGNIVLAPISTMILIYVRPGEAYGWTWDQKDGDGKQVDPGTYTVVLTTSAGTSRATFSIGSVKADPNAGESTPPAPPAVSSDLPFSDVTGADQADSYIAALKAKGVVNGRGGDKFEPDRMVTRAEFIAMLLRAFEVEPLAEDTETEFAAVSRDHWSFGYIAKAYELGFLDMVQPVEDGDDFGPDFAITEAEMNRIVVNATTGDAASSGALAPVSRRQACIVIYNLMDHSE
ncbi:MAG: S-layer homology domain-containing protein [Bacillota bacterium]